AVMVASQSDVKKGAAGGFRDGLPVLATEVTIDADRLRHHGRPSEIGEDERDVAGTGDHRMIAIGAALSGATGVHVHIGDDAQAALLADVPERTEIPAI